MARHRIGIIGLGMALKPHALSLRDLADRVEVAAAFAPSAARRDEAARAWGVPVVDSLDRILGDRSIDTVLILTPPWTHTDLVIQAAAAGKHILLEKPVEASAARATAIVAACERAGVRLAIVFQHRFRPAALELATLVHGGKLGPLLSASASIRWWRSPEYFAQPGRGTMARDGGGVLLTQAIHTLDLLLHLAGPVQEVMAYVDTSPLRAIDTEDIVAASVRYAIGATKFELMSTPGETPDHLTVWIPKYRAAFVGDNYYESFPNMYTLRGTKPRWALDYIASLNKVLALKPELLLPSHGEPVRGNAEITRRLTQYRDAIAYVHDAVVRGMNDGKDVFTLMHEIKLPPELVVGEGYGNLIWSIRGIYEGYAGWFDMRPATMYDVPMDAVFPDLAKLAGGAEPVVKLASQYVENGRYVEALHLTDVALASDPGFRPALETRLKALEGLREKSKNSNERGWLDYHIRTVKKRLSG